MAVYVDRMQAEFRRMVMCHMVADTSRELKEMAKKIGVKEKWIQGQGTYKEHFDVCLSKRKLALANGAIEISREQLFSILEKKRKRTIMAKGI